VQKVWPFIYLAGAIFLCVGTSNSLSPQRTAHTNVDWIFIGLSFGGGVLFPMLAMRYSLSRGIEAFHRPSLKRAPHGWWTDTLQPIRITWICLALTVVGSSFSLPRADHKGVMTFLWYAAMAVGFFIGERIVCCVFGKRIIR
jgi:hypothetical protein